MTEVKFDPGSSESPLWRLIATDYKTKERDGGNCWLVLGGIGQFGWVLFGTWWYWVRIGWYWLIFDSSGSVQGGTGWYLVGSSWYCLVLSGIGLV